MIYIKEKTFIQSRGTIYSYTLKWKLSTTSHIIDPLLESGDSKELISVGYAIFGGIGNFDVYKEKTVLIICKV